MIRLGLRLAVAGGREALVRLAITAAAVALGVGLLLTTLAGINATDSQNARYAWLNTGLVEGTSAGAADPLWWLARADHVDGHRIARVDVAATGPAAPVPPGIPRLPGPGEYYTSPALRDLIRSMPAAELGDRFPGRRIGTIGPDALPAPDSLVAVVGWSPDRLAQAPNARRASSIADVTPSRCSRCAVGINVNGMTLILGVAAGALIFPLLVLIGTATRLTATRREQRFAAMRLVGAAPRQVSLIAAVESTVAALAGVAAGFGLFFLLRGPAAAIPFTGERFFPADLSLGPVEVLLVAVGVPVAAAVAARLALRRVQISPLGVTRRVTPRPPRAHRLVPLVAGLGELAYFVGRRPDTTNGQLWAYLSGILLAMLGLVVAGPWLTLVGARFMARRTNRPAVLIAGRRLSDNPQAGFRAVSGLVLALFVTSVSVGVITTMVANRGLPTGDPAATHTLVADLSEGRTGAGEPVSSAAAPPDTVLSGLRAVPGVRGVALMHTNPLGTRDPVADDGPTVAGLASCAEIARLPGFGRCAPGAEVASVPPAFDHIDDVSHEVWPAAAVSTDELRRLPVQQVAVATDGSTTAVERARTLLAAAYPGRRPAATTGEFQAEAARDLAGQQRLAEVVIIASLPIAGCGLAVSVAGGLSERKRPFSLLRLTGIPLRVLRRVVALESAVPLLVAAVVAAGTGFLAAHLFVRSQFGYSLRPPGVEYYAIVLAGLAGSLGIIAATLPLLARITGPETARNE